MSINRGHWKKGQSGNPKGRPPGRNWFSTMVKAYLDEQMEIPDGPDKSRLISRGERLVMLTYSQAEQGDKAAAKLLFDEARRAAELDFALAPGEAESDQTERMIAAHNSLAEKVMALRRKVDARKTNESAVKDGTEPSDTPRTDTPDATS